MNHPHQRVQAAYAGVEKVNQRSHISHQVQRESLPSDRRENTSTGVIVATVASSLLIVAGISLAAGYWAGTFAHRTDVDGPSANQALRNRALASMLPGQTLSELPLQAATATTGGSFAVATGMVDSDVEGLYVLDFVTGDLQCSVLNFRTGKFNAVFRANVLQDLGSDGAVEGKNPTFLLSTGMINFPRGASVARPGNSVCYVLDTTTGSYAAYAIPWRRELAATGRPQSGALMLLDVGRARTLAIRE